MPDATSCRHCGEILQATVAFCPFCGTAQAPAAPAPVPPPVQVAPVRVAPNQASARKASVPEAAHRPVERPVPPGPASPGPVSPGPTSSFRAFRTRVFSPRTVPLPPRPPRRLPVPASPAVRAGAMRKLLLATLILGCAAVLWHHLAVGPRATLLVHLARPVEGTVLVDGASAGSPDRPIAIDPGRHLVGFAAVGWSTVPVTVSLREGSTRTVSLAPAPHRAVLGLDGLPQGSVLSLNGRRIGHAPPSLSLPPGSYRLEAALSGFVPEERRVTLGPGERRDLVFALQPLPVRTQHLVAPVGSWSEPVTLPQHSRFTLLFRGRIRVRDGGRVLLLEGGAPAGLGALDGDSLSFTAVDDEPVPVVVVSHGVGAPG